MGGGGEPAKSDEKTPLSRYPRAPPSGRQGECAQSAQWLRCVWPRARWDDIPHSIPYLCQLLPLLTENKS